MDGQRPTRRPAGIAGAVVVLLLAVAVLLIAISKTTVTYALPPSRGTDVLQRGSATWGPGVAAAGVSVVAVLVALGWLLWQVFGQPSPRWWWPVGGLVLLAAVVTIVVSGMDTGAF